MSVSDFFVVPAGYSTGQVVYTGRTSVGSSTHVSINSAGGIGLLLFDGTVGQGVSVNVTNSTICGYGSSITMLSPTGNTVPPGGCGGNSFFFGQVLPSTGTYTLLINPGGSTGSLDIQLSNIVNLTGTITIGGPAVATNFSVPGQAAKLMFNGTAGQRVSLEILPSSVSSCVSILNPDQTTLTNPCTNGSNGFIDTQTLPWTGTYAVYVYDSGTTTGSLSVRLYEVPADFSVSASPGGTPVTVVIVKYDDTEVALTVSLRSNGDIEVYMAKDVARKILAALARAVE